MSYEDDFRAKLKAMQEMKRATHLRQSSRNNRKKKRAATKIKPKDLMSIRASSQTYVSSGSGSGSNTDEMISNTDEDKEVFAFYNVFYVAPLLWWPVAIMLQVFGEDICGALVANTLREEETTIGAAFTREAVVGSSGYPSCLLSTNHLCSIVVVSAE